MKRCGAPALQTKGSAPSQGALGYALELRACVRWCVRVQVQALRGSL